MFYDWSQDTETGRGDSFKVAHGPVAGKDKCQKGKDGVPVLAKDTSKE